MGDQYLMENLLFGSKVVNDLFLHGFIEASNERVFDAFTKSMKECAKMHYDLFQGMETAGFYRLQNVDENKIKQTKQKLKDSLGCLKEEW